MWAFQLQLKASQTALQGKGLAEGAWGGGFPAMPGVCMSASNPGASHAASPSVGLQPGQCHSHTWPCAQPRETQEGTHRLPDDSKLPLAGETVCTQIGLAGSHASLPMPSG